MASHGVTALCPLDLRHETRARMASHGVTALCRLDLRPATLPSPPRGLIPASAPRREGRLSDTLLEDALGTLARSDRIDPDLRLPDEAHELVHLGHAAELGFDLIEGPTVAP